MGVFIFWWDYEVNVKALLIQKKQVGLLRFLWFLGWLFLLTRRI